MVMRDLGYRREAAGTVTTSAHAVNGIGA